METVDNLKELLDEIRSTDYKLTSSGKAISQKPRNDLKVKLTEAVVGLLADAGMFIVETIDGQIIEVQNDDLGVIPVELNLKIKNVDYDIDGAIESLEIKEKEKAVKEAKKAKDAEKRNSGK